jgi:hypothetical protein
MYGPAVACRSLRKYVSLLLQGFERAAILVELGPLFGKEFFIGLFVRPEALQHAMCFEFFPDQPAREVVLVRCKTKVQFLIELCKRLAELLLSRLK